MAFVPSTSFYSRPGTVVEAETPACDKPKTRFPPTNTLAQRKDLDEATPSRARPSPAKTLPFQPSLYPLADPEEPAPREVPREDIPLTPDEATDQILQNTLSGRFLSVPPQQKPARPRSKPAKPVENYVKLNLSKSASFRKMGKTFAATKRRRYFSSASHLAPPSIIVYSQGFHAKSQTAGSDPDEILLREFGFESWNPGQKEAVGHLLAGENTLVVLPTGAGKSLVYQMATRLSSQMTIVISPLISLITDQVLRLPCNLSGAILNSALVYQDQFKVLKSVKQGLIDVLYMTPEKFITDEIQMLDNIGLVCIDEAHCISAYSSSCRVSYKVLPKYLKQHKIVALTGTANEQTQTHLKELLQITRTVSTGQPLRTNVEIRVTRVSDPLDAVSRLIRSKAYCTGSVLIYSPFQALANNIAQWLASQGERCASYHAGIASEKRDEIQQKFCEGTIRVLVATVSFGMGIDKPDIRGIIHACIPKSVEQLIQEVGRAGRDGHPAFCHVLVDATSLYFLRGLVFANHVLKRHVIKLLKQLNTTKFWNIKETCADFGISEETLYELFLVLERKGILTIEGTVPLSVQLRFYKTATEELAKKYAIISHVLVKARNFAGVRRVSVDILASSMQVSYKEIVYTLKRLAATGEISCEFSDQAFVVVSQNVPQDARMIEIATETETELTQLEQVYKLKVETLYSILHELAGQSLEEAQDVREHLQEVFIEYLAGRVQRDVSNQPLPSELERDFHAVMAQFDGVPDSKDLVCILQGINSVRTPYRRWSASMVWKRYTRSDFFELLRRASAFILDELELKSDYLAKKFKAN